ncbi:LGFP repeat-containing protein [Mycobacterium talmoniae]|nr:MULTISPECIES: hypothetical protein [Mycobacterium]TDH56239.1 hypothetical protein E2F47_07820 [Mycobacterium eburneum]
MAGALPLVAGCATDSATRAGAPTSAGKRGGVAPTPLRRPPNGRSGAHGGSAGPASGDVSTAGSEGTEIATPNGEFSVQGAILQKYAAVGGPSSRLGLPTSGEQPGPGDGQYSVFEGGAIYWSPLTGGHVIWGAIRGSWDSQGGPGGPLGYPTTDEIAFPDGWQQSFQHGVITYTDRPHIQRTRHGHSWSRSAAWSR